MQPAGAEMPKYKCHKEVWALKIAGILGHVDLSATMIPAESGYGHVRLSREYIAKHNPYVGGYYVVYADGYESFSPDQAFEEGYTRI